MRPDRAFPLPPPSRRRGDPALPLRRFLAKRAVKRLLSRLYAALGLRRDPTGRTTAKALAHLDDHLLRDVGLRREEGPRGERYRRL